MFQMIRAGINFVRVCERLLAMATLDDSWACSGYGVTKEGYKSKIAPDFCLMQLICLQ